MAAVNHRGDRVKGILWIPITHAALPFMSTDHWDLAGEQRSENVLWAEKYFWLNFKAAVGNKNHKTDILGNQNQLPEKV